MFSSPAAWGVHAADPAEFVQSISYALHLSDIVRIVFFRPLPGFSLNLPSRDVSGGRSNQSPAGLGERKNKRGDSCVWRRKNLHSKDRSVTA